MAHPSTHQVEALNRAIELIGGTQASLAHALGLRSYQNVQGWLKAGRVPAEHCPRIERLTNGEVRCEQLNDSVDWAYLRERVAG